MQNFFKTVCLSLLLSTTRLGFDAATPDIAFAETEPPILAQAVMAESIEKFAPVNEAVVFSIDLGRINCFTEFDPVPNKSIIYHKWYYRGTLVSAKQLTINPPRWSSFTSMQLRTTDKGPWQVDVTDENGDIIKTLRFSITD